MANKAKITCPKCDGKGVLPRYFYNRKGICFECWGAGTITVKLQEGETAKEAYKRLSAEADAELEKNPPKVAMPDKMKNKTFDNDMEREHFTAKKRDSNVGKESTATTERGTSVKTRYRVVDANELIASHTLTGQENPKFPKELQPRDRSRTASKLQVEQIANSLDYNRLSASSLASNGSPIVAKDKVVESGNGRILAIKLAYEKNNQASKNYKEALMKNASELGLSPSEIAKVNNPVLIRERISEVDRVKFTKEANESGVSSMSASEQAKTDAEALTHFIMEQYEGGDLKAAKNRSFVNAFMQNIVAAGDRNKFITEKVDKDGMKTGVLSSEGEARIKNAMFHKAYGDASLLTKKAELDDTSNVKNVLQAMDDNAVLFAKMKSDIEAGYLHNHDISPDLVEAVKKADELRAKGESVTEYLNQPSFFGPEMSEESRAILFFLETNKRNKGNIDAFMKAYVDELEALGNPSEIDMFSDVAALSTGYLKKMDLVESAIKRVQPEILEELKRIAKG